MSSADSPTNVRQLQFDAQNTRICGEKVSKHLHRVQPSLHSDSLPPRTPNPWSEAKERGTQVVGANLTVIREKRRLFQR
jgi:hypothetical protein